MSSHSANLPRAASCSLSDRPLSWVSYCACRALRTRCACGCKCGSDCRSNGGVGAWVGGCGSENDLEVRDHAITVAGTPPWPNSASSKCVQPHCQCRALGVRKEQSKRIDWDTGHPECSWGRFCCERRKCPEPPLMSRHSRVVTESCACACRVVLGRPEQQVGIQCCFHCHS